MTRPRSLVLLLLLAACGAGGAALGLGFLGRLHPAFDTFAHFRLHLAALLAVGGVLLLMMTMRREGLAALSLAACSVIVTPGALPGLGSSRAALAGDHAAYRLLHLNARFDNREPELFLSLIARTRPDVVTVNEVSEMWRTRLAALDASYPYRIICRARGAVGGIAILSRRPFAAGTEPQCLAGGTLALAHLDLGGRPVAAAALHLYWPWPFEQPEQVEEIVGHLANLPDEAVLAGDFNAVRWSRAVGRIAEAGRLRDAGPVGPSWLPRRFPDLMRRTIGLGIDHVLAGDGIGIERLERVEDAGSDHLPVLAEFWLPAASAPPEERTKVVDGAVPGRRGASAPI